MQDSVRQRPWRAFDFVNHWSPKNNRSVETPQSSPKELEAKPSGGNIMMGDGHVEWRGFSQMKERYELAGAGYYWY